MKPRGRLAAIVIAALLLAVLGSWWGWGVVDRDVDFVVPRGATLTSVAAKLEKEKVIGSASGFLWRAKLFGSSDPIKAGEFRLPKGASRARILDILQHGKPIRRIVTIPEGMPAIMVQERLLALNPGLLEHRVEMRPDGDAELPVEAVQSFRVADCLHCGGALKPDVVFFGDNVPRPTVDAAFSMLEEGDALLVVGSSLAVFSGYRFLLRAAERHMPIGLINLGESRGLELADVRVEARAGEVLPRLAAALAQG